MVLAYNVANGIRMYRISSDLIPFASHPVNQLDWRDEFAPMLRSLGRFIARHDLRVSMHPGQFTLLNAKRGAIVRNAILDLAWHARRWQKLSSMVLGGAVLGPDRPQQFRAIRLGLRDGLRGRLGRLPDAGLRWIAGGARG